MGTALLAVAALTWSATPASAQHGGHGGGGHGGGGHGGGAHMSGFHGGAHVSGFHGGVNNFHGGFNHVHNGFNHFHDGHFHGSYYPWFWGGLGWGLGYGWPGWDYGYGYYPGYYDYGYNSYPDYSYGYAPDYYPYNPNYAALSTYQAGATQYSQPSYPAPRASGAAPVTVRILLPTTDAQVWFNGTQTTETGTDRLFTSPPITPDKNYTYEIKARWTQDGTEVVRTRTLPVHPGQRLMVNFSQPEPSQQPAPTDTAPPPPKPPEPRPGK
jgi:uncharacterized protein (TIGR03000 family)